MKLIYSAEQNNVKQIVVDAGKRLLHMKGATVLGSKNLGHGHGIDIVTKADIATETYLREQLGKYFPSVGFYSEETAKVSEKELAKERVWVVDPVDGTLMFSRGLPFYGISVALLVDQKPVFGCIYLPEFDDLYWAIRDGGAYHDRKKLHVSSHPDHQKWYGVIGMIGLTPDKEEKIWSLFIRNHFLIRGTSCAVFHHVHTAAGHYDLDIAIGQALWDIAAGQVLIEEAGGKITYFNRRANNQTKDDFYFIRYVAGNPHAVKYLAPKLEALMKHD